MKLIGRFSSKIKYLIRLLNPLKSHRPNLARNFGIANYHSTKFLQSKIVNGSELILNDQMLLVNEAIKSVEKEIQKLGDGVSKIELQLESVSDQKTIDYLREEKKSLRDEKLLREKEIILLREKEIILLQQEKTSLTDMPPKKKLLDAFNDPLSVEDFLRGNNLIPDKVAEAEPLAELGAVSRESCLLLNRDHTINLFQDMTSKKLALRHSADKESQPHIICMAGPGTGKSRLADYGLTALKKASPEQYPELAALANSKAALAVNISFNARTTFCLRDIDIGAQAAVGNRLLASYFGFDFCEHVFPDSVSKLTISVSVETILKDHLSRNPGLSRKDVLIYIAIDDVSNICGPMNCSDWTLEKGKVFLKDILDGIAVLYSQQDYFLVAMITGTVFGPTSDILRLSQRPYKNLAVPLLSHAESVELAEDAFRRAGVSGGVSSETKLLLSDIGGIPRFIWQAINAVIDSGDGTNFSDLRSQIKAIIKSRYRPAGSGMSWKKISTRIVSTALRREPVDPSGPCTDNWLYTWTQLENQGLCFLSPEVVVDSTRKVYIWLPLMHLETLIEPFPAMKYFVDRLRDNQWESWERFCLMYEALLMTQHVLERKSQVTVGEYYRGALVGEGVQDRILSLPMKLPIMFIELPKRFPETAGTTLPATDASEVYKNCQGAKVDGFIRHSNPKVLRCLHFRHTRRDKVFDYEATAAETVANMESSVRHRIEPDVELVHVYQSNRELKGDVGKILAGKDVVVTRSELTGFFGRTFAERIGLMFFKEE